MVVLVYGMDIIVLVDKIMGSGNVFVVVVKWRVFGKVGIDMIVGFLEIFVIVDKDNNLDWIVLDLLSQVEYDESV